MKCIDAVEGVILSVVREFFSEYCPSRDDSEYALNIKIIIKAVEKFVREHKEIIGDSDILKKILYEQSRDLWISDMIKRLPEDSDIEKEREYYTYYFDHLYNNGAYPP